MKRAAATLCSSSAGEHALLLRVSYRALLVAPVPVLLIHLKPALLLAFSLVVTGRIPLTCHKCGAEGSAGAGREARAGGGRGFCWAKKVRSQLGIGPDGEISCAPILCI